LRWIPKTGLLTQVSSVAGLPPTSTLGPGMPRAPVGSPDAPAPRNTDNDIWAADIHITPNGKFLYISERTSSILSTFAVDAQAGKLTYLGSTPTEKHPRGFASIPPANTWSCPARSPTRSRSTRSMRPAALCVCCRSIQAGKGANWVEIVDLD
jgi:6-phosphogluconolactonase